MQKVLLFFLFISAQLAIAQNQKPIAVNDTIFLRYSQVHSDDSLQLNLNQILSNDYDPDGSNLGLIDLLYSGSNQVYGLKPSSSFIQIWYKVQPNYSGTETFQYVISDFGSPEKKDTAQVAITVMSIAHAQLTANNIKPTITSEVLFSHMSHSRHLGFIAPSNSESSTIFAANLWLSGLKDGVIYSNHRLYGSPATPINGISNSSNPGPVSDLSHVAPYFNSPWNRVWKVTKEQIDFHLANYQNNGYVANKAILDWPTHGIILDGEPNFIAPYFDRNNDLLYDPYDGDYPIIKGDEAIFFLYNDGGSPLISNPMRSEIHGLVYAFSCGDSAMANTIFVDYKIINRSQNTYDNTHLGMWTDFDNGNPSDDYLQTDVERNLQFCLNGDDFDEDNGGKIGYKNHPPSQGVLLLKGPKKDTDGIDNSYGVNPNESINGKGFGDGIIDNEYWGMQYSILYSASSFALNQDLVNYNLLQNNDLSGTPLLNLNGHDHKYIFPNDSDPLYFSTHGTSYSPWTEASIGNSPRDISALTSTGPVTFAPNDTIELTYAFVFGRDYVNTGAQAGVDNMLERVDSIQSYYDQGLLAPCGFPSSINDKKTKTQSFVVYPNPTKDVLNIQQEIGSELQISIFDVTGKLLLTTHSSEKQVQINTNNLPNGLYVISIQSPIGKSSQMFIKN